MYGAINTYYTITNGLYVIQLLSDAYTLQNNTTIYGQVISFWELVVKAQYLCSMQENTNWYWKQQPLQQTIMFPTRTILHPCLDVIIIRYVQDTLKKLFWYEQSKKINIKTSNYCDWRWLWLYYGCNWVFWNF